MDSLTEKVVLITGAGSGIGKATAASFAARGARVVLVGRRKTTLEEVASELRDQGSQVWVGTADITSKNEVEALVSWVNHELGEVDILVNNAGCASNTLNARWIEEEEWDQVQDVNLKAVFLLTQAVLPAMISRQYGTIITVSSLAALRPNLLGGAAYGAAKAGVRNFMTYLHNTYRNNGIRSTCILPGEVNTPIMDNRANPPLRSIRENMVQPEDVAEAILLCASLPARTVIEELIVAPTFLRDISGDLEISRWKNAPPECRVEREKYL
ncbi:SDR family oxidoreductase [Citrobacter freundii]|uniref:SDR family oxidoreductase n=1 Tax=Citrobacter freundii TaxID=546 RepID=UPI000C80F236|nr:SDR family oxidoreductase [Citrobacter freundii]EMB4337308.1 SDR family oxidoreductase [Citrobacter freundii]MBJ9041954.1 SDR family oxidoreductase [Citrobacter freundii]NTY76546.1 SDR family oxidoreductase [Citrobacter freundii]NUA12994.1 SDR family oxidoreductase [Citrobacter freundii]PMD03424.1 3-oxoacyl-ACP reductase [Citrobacter freundii]